MLAARWPVAALLFGGCWLWLANLPSFVLVMVLAIAGVGWHLHLAAPSARRIPPSKKEQGVKMGSWSPSVVACPASEADLQALLTSGGIDATAFGKGSAKPVASLLDELRSGDCRLERGPISGRLTRLVEPVFVALRFRGRVLVEKSQVLPDGRLRERKILLAEKRQPGDRSAVEAALRCILEELNVRPTVHGRGVDSQRDGGASPCYDASSAEGLQDASDMLRDMLLHHQEADACFLEELEASVSYPGLQSVYRNYTVNLEIPETSDVAMSVFAHCGLPACQAFETSEQKAAEAFMKHTWVWMSDDEVRAAGGVIGLLTADGQPTWSTT
eukprot:TRINITY_DN32643_c0_g1_i1.p1 TRINITY_DN32643_c0_g1~~TRINITY_DN32643_c0_g1_i1.p1  ORF type:complete len:330 (-),score=79.52 TRINITY_DN32643_c0_g1_i1:236-1225(-)